MSNSSADRTAADWANLDSANERVTAPVDVQAVLAHVPAKAPIPATGSAAAKPAGRHRRTSRAAAVTAAAACALAVSASASAASLHPAATASWKIVKTVPGSSVNFTAVTATSKSNAWAFESSSGGTSAWRLGPSGWTPAAFPGGPVAAAGASSASDVWTITADGAKSKALRWNGSGWVSAGTIRAEIAAVTVVSSSDVWAFALPFFPSRGSAWHYNGTRWSRVASGNGLISGSALSPRNVWAVGGEAVAHWNGHTWSRTSVAGLLPANTMLSHSAMVGIYAASSRNVWALGTGGREDEGGPTVLLHYNGHHWSRAAINLSGNPSQLVPDGTGGLWVPVPSQDGVPFEMLRYSGGHLRAVSMPVSGARLDVLAVAAVPHSAETLGVGFTHKKNNAGLGIAGVILSYQR